MNDKDKDKKEKFHWWESLVILAMIPVIWMYFLFGRAFGFKVTKGET